MKNVINLPTAIYYYSLLYSSYSIHGYIKFYKDLAEFDRGFVIQFNESE